MKTFIRSYPKREKKGKKYVHSFMYEQWLLKNHQDHFEQVKKITENVSWKEKDLKKFKANVDKWIA